MTNEEASVEDFNSKIARMRKDLAARGGSLSLSLAAPPLWRIAWRLGLKWTPPLFRSFWVNALAFGSVWAVVWLIAWMYLPFLPMPDGVAAVGSALFGGLIFAVVTAGVADVHRKRLQLPHWRRY
jgi:hypothetical protein